MSAALQPPRVYMAGKVEKNGWRHDLVPRLRGWEQGDGPIVCPRFVYVGPWVLSCDHGCRHRPGNHGLAGSGCDGVIISRREVFTDNQTSLVSADLVFAFIEARDAFGTIAEIGFAAKASIPVYLCFAPDLDRDDFWYVELMTEPWEGPLTVSRDGLPAAFDRALRAWKARG